MSLFSKQRDVAQKFQVIFLSSITKWNGLARIGTYVSQDLYLSCMLNRGLVWRGAAITSLSIISIICPKSPQINIWYKEKHHVNSISKVSPQDLLLTRLLHPWAALVLFQRWALNNGALYLLTPEKCQHVRKTRVEMHLHPPSPKLELRASDTKNQEFWCLKEAVITETSICCSFSSGAVSSTSGDCSPTCSIQWFSSGGHSVFVDWLMAIFRLWPWLLIGALPSPTHTPSSVHFQSWFLHLFQ